MKSKKITITTHLADFHSKLFRYYIPITKELGDQFVDGDNRRITCSINGNTPYQCALMHMEGGYYILVNNQERKKIGIDEGDEITVTIEKDHSEFGHDVPESFQVLLDQDDEGRTHFEGLTKGKQRSLIYIVKKVKNVDSQLAKGLAIMHHLKEAKGVLDFKRLNELIKEYNNRK
ncbi:YdeI/OmpD-associated family protein [Ekhidna sp.]|uniref:YdeI/OmpD-associated family protein n=1 Tax=Ekhidna sp. TaxID=2608089 RepID=UPI003518A745